MQCKVIPRRWGNSIGVILPKEVVEGEDVKENRGINIVVLGKNKKIKKIFGMLKKDRLKQSTQEIKEELRKELYDD